LGVTDADSVKKYALVSYMKLLTARVLRLEEEMKLQKKTSVVMVNRTDSQGQLTLGHGDALKA
jgi:hypothetical protein